MRRYKLVFYVSDAETGAKLEDWRQIKFNEGDCKTVGVTVERDLEALIGVRTLISDPKDGGEDVFRPVRAEAPRERAAREVSDLPEGLAEAVCHLLLSISHWTGMGDEVSAECVGSSCRKAV